MRTKTPMVYKHKDSLMLGVKYHCQATRFEPEIIRRVILIIEKNFTLVYAHIELFMETVKQFISNGKEIIIEQFLFKKALEHL